MLHPLLAQGCTRQIGEVGVVGRPYGVEIDTFEEHTNVNTTTWIWTYRFGRLALWRGNTIVEESIELLLLFDRGKKRIGDKGVEPRG